MTGSLPVGAPQRSRHLGPFLWTFISSFSSRRRKKKVSVTVLLDVMESREQGTHTHQSPERGKTRQAATFSDSASDQWRKNDTERRCLNFFCFLFRAISPRRHIRVYFLDARKYTLEWWMMEAHKEETKIYTSCWTRTGGKKFPSKKLDI